MRQILNRDDFIDWAEDADIPYDQNNERVKLDELSPHVALEVLVTANDAGIDLLNDSLTAGVAEPNSKVTDTDSFRAIYQGDISEVKDEHAHIEMNDISQFDTETVVEICKTVHATAGLHFGGYNVVGGSGGWGVIYG